MFYVAYLIIAKEHFLYLEPDSRLTAQEILRILNHSIHKSINQSINESINQSIICLYQRYTNFYSLRSPQGI
jgi:hypothetical protein